MTNIPEGFVSIEDYGAIGDGTTNSTSAFIDAISSEEYIWIPEGVFKTSVIDITNPNIEMKGTGDNSILDCGFGGSAVRDGLGTAIAVREDNITLSDFKITNSPSYNLENGVGIVGSYNHINNLTIGGFKSIKTGWMPDGGKGIGMGDGLQVSHNLIENCRISNCRWGLNHGQDYIHYPNTQYNTFYNNIVTNCDAGAVVTKFNEPPTSGLVTPATPPTPYVYDAYDSFINNQFINCIKGVLLSRASKVIITNNYISNNFINATITSPLSGQRSTWLNAIHMTGSQSNYVFNNKIKGKYTSVYFFGGIGGSPRYASAYNTFLGNKFNGTATYGFVGSTDLRDTCSNNFLHNELNGVSQDSRKYYSINMRDTIIDTSIPTIPFRSYVFNRNKTNRLLS